jgi:hypothetical protein
LLRYQAKQALELSDDQLEEVAGGAQPMDTPNTFCYVFAMSL